MRFSKHSDGEHRVELRGRQAEYQSDVRSFKQHVEIHLGGI